MRPFTAVLALSCALVASTVVGAKAEETLDKSKTPAFMVLDPNAPRPELAKGEPLPQTSTPPTPAKRFFGIPTVRSTKTSDGEAITLSNDALGVNLHIDSDRHIRITGIRTSSGKELLGQPAPCLVIADEKGEIIRDGGSFIVDSWVPHLHGSYAEVEVHLKAPENCTWRVRAYRDKPYLEQRFELPEEWRKPGTVLAQVLPTSQALKPVMPNNSFGRGFSDGRPNITGRHRFEFINQSDHLCYDLKGKAGLAGFSAGIGGEERICSGRFALIDHTTEQFGSKEPPARFILWPFEGPVETGFMDIRRFISSEYSCQGEKTIPFSWNQFWLWQGGIQPASREVVTAKRLLDILPHIASLGCEEFHLDAGWEVGPGDWRFDPKRFPQGFEPLRKFLREHGMRYHTWMNDGTTDDPEAIKSLIDQTDMCKLFQDRTVDEKSINAIRKVREKDPDMETFVHHSTSRSACYWWGNIHFLSDFNQIYFGEGEYWAWSNVLPEKPEGDVNRRFFSRHSLRAGDLVTRSAAYQVHWTWPFRCVVPPHVGWAWFEDRDISELSSRMFTTLAARADYQWGFDPRMLRRELIDLFLDWTAFLKAMRPYMKEYQHILPVPDGVHPDGAAHMLDGRGFLVICNPGKEEAKVPYKDILWEPELELDPNRKVELTDWTKPLSPKLIGSVDITSPSGELLLAPLSYRVVGIDLDLDTALSQIKRQRTKIGWPPKE